MTQRVFDVENEKDMADLWDILPDDVIKVKLREGVICYDGGDEDEYFEISDLLNVNFQGKTEIHRPLKEATEADVGKLCKFWNNDGTRAYGVLSDLITSGIKNIKYGCCYGTRWTHARRLTKQEIEELC